MTKIAVILAPGFEEIEALSPVDVFRRVGFDVDMVGFAKQVSGAHNITVTADVVIEEADFSIYDLIVIPGGLPGATNLRDNELVIQAVQEAAATNRKTAAICAGPIVLEKAGLLENKRFTNYPGFEAQIEHGEHQPEAIVVRDGNVITSRGPATAMAFAYELVAELGVDPHGVREEMQYNALAASIKADK